MKIASLFKNKKVTFSFEVFPPKTDDAYASVKEAVSVLSSLLPDYMSVTYGAGGGTSKNTVRIASDIQNKYQTTALAHLTCLSSTRRGVDQLLEDLEAQGVDNVLALRGDYPQGVDPNELPHEYRYAHELVAQIRRRGGFCIGAACHPEGHADSPNLEADVCHLRQKVDAGVDFLVSQLFFDNAVFYRFLSLTEKHHIDVPILAGIFPITSPRQIDRIVKLSGAAIPADLQAILDRWGHDPLSIKEAGIEFATKQIVDLVKNNVRGIHLYTMNKPDVAASIRDNVKDLIDVTNR